ncbi:MAG: acyl-CoA dehydrogenase family protein [Desulfobacterales bacterium]|nr:acyl-CoA dehydrogenase family protein [Desulfobacterales bacterium]
MTELIFKNCVVPSENVVVAGEGTEGFKKTLEVVSDSLQMFGACGYSQDLPLERMLRDVRMFQIGGGTTQAQLNMLARSVFKRKFAVKKRTTNGQAGCKTSN